MTAGVYCIRNKISGRVYVGSSLNIEDRWYAHTYMLRRGEHHSPAFQRSWDKHGQDVFEFVILRRVLKKADESVLLRMEQAWIDKLQAASPDLGLNVSAVAGTRRGVPQPPSVAEKLREVHLGKPKSEEHRAKIGAGNKGKKRTPEMKAHNSLMAKKQFANPVARAKAAEYAKMGTPWLRGKTLPQEMKDNLSRKAKDRYQTPEGKAQLALMVERARQATLGKPGPWAGKKMPAEARAKMSAAHKGVSVPSRGRPHSEKWRQNHSAKLTGKPRFDKRTPTEAEVDQMVELRTTGLSFTKISSLVDRSEATIHKFVTRRLNGGGSQQCFN